VGRGTENFGALVPIYGTLSRRWIAMLIARSGEFRYRLVPDRDPPALLRHRSAGQSSCSQASLNHLRHVGSICFVPSWATTSTPWLDELLSAFRSWPVVPGPPIGLGMLTARHCAGHHGDSVHLLGHARGVSNVPVHLKESAYAVGKYHLGGVWDIVLPYTRSATIGGIFLDWAPLGETMAGRSCWATRSAHPVTLQPGNSIAAPSPTNSRRPTRDLFLSSLIALASCCRGGHSCARDRRLMPVDSARRAGKTS